MKKLHRVAVLLPASLVKAVRALLLTVAGVATPAKKKTDPCSVSQGVVGFLAINLEEDVLRTKITQEVGLRSGIPQRDVLRTRRFRKGKLAPCTRRRQAPAALRQAVPRGGRSCLGWDSNSHRAYDN